MILKLNLKKNKCSSFTFYKFILITSFILNNINKNNPYTVYKSLVKSCLFKSRCDNLNLVKIWMSMLRSKYHSDKNVII